jgi:hypothetical protein
MEDRYARQRLLAAVGDVGQARIAAATYVVSSAGSASSEVEREYLTRAGARLLVADGAPPPAFAHAAAFQNEGARDYAAGAWRALTQLRNVLEQAP